MKRTMHTPKQIIRKFKTAEQLISCQATAKTGPDATRKLVHPVEQIGTPEKENRGLLECGQRPRRTGSS
jgi:hypothetical protein